MFNLANIFGIGKSETENPSSPNLNDDNHSSSSSTSDSTAYSENDLGDWILIDPEIKKKNQPAVAAVTAAEESAVKQIRKSKKNSRGNKPSLEKVQSLEESSWHIDPPECFKASPEASQVQTSSSLENLLIEIPNMSVFDNFFTKKIFIVKEEPKLKKPNPLELTKKTSANGAKENANPASARSNKKKQLEIAVNVLPVFNQKNKALTANIQQNGETAFPKKNYEKITKKNYKRQNLVAKQRNGPIIRKQKMFTHLNGAYHTRNQNY